MTTLTLSRQFEPQHAESTLLYRRQFVVGPKPVKGRFDAWSRVELSAGRTLTAHPELDVLHLSEAEHSVTSLGQVLDPDRPTDDNEAVVQRLLNELSSCRDLDQFPEHLFRLGGRWALIVRKGGECRVYNDAAGTRQLFWATTPEEGCWLASTPDLLAEELGFEISEDAHELMRSRDYQRLREYWWPGTRTRYSQVDLLLPNHYLDLNGCSTHRYFPVAERSTLTLLDGVERIAELLRGGLRAAALRRPLALSVTAGYDSRVTMAACRDLNDRVQAFSFVHAHITDRDPDVLIPARVLEPHGVPHSVFRCPQKADPAFAELYFRNTPTGKASWAAVAQGMYQNLPGDVLRVTSNVAEVARCFYSVVHNGRARECNGENFGRMTRLGVQPFVVDAFNGWLEKWPSEFGYDVFDLFYWEQRLASWAGSIYLEFDIVQDGFTPFSCRELMTTMLAIDEAHRLPPDYPLLVSLVQRMWPELLAEPINPEPPGRLAREIRKRSRKFLKDCRRALGRLRNR